MTHRTATLDSDPTGLGAVISTAVKATLIALIATNALPWDDAQVTAVGLAVATLVDLGIVLGLIRPRVTPTVNPHTNDRIRLVPDASK